LVTSFDVASKPNVFDYMNYKWWRANMVLWLTTMNIFYIAKGKAKQFTPEQEQVFKVVKNLFQDVIINVLGENIVDVYMLSFAKEMWEVIETKFGVS